MMIFDEITDSAQKFCSDTDTTVKTFLQKMINEGYYFILAEMGRSNTEKTRTDTTVASQQYYDTAMDYQEMVSVDVTVGGTKYNPTEAQSQDFWDALNMDTSVTGDEPQYWFMRRGLGIGGAELGLYPIPASKGNTITEVYRAMDRPMTATKYTTGTVTVTNADATVTGSGTTFTAAMVGRYFQTTADGYWYKIETFTSATSLELDRVFDGSTAAAAAYTIAEAPNIPHEGHILLAYFASAHYFGGPRKDLSEEAKYWNLFYTGDPQNSARAGANIRGGLIGMQRRYGTKSSSQVFKSVRYQQPLWNPNFTPKNIT